MFSKKKLQKTSPVAAVPAYTWASPDERAQELWVQVKDINYKLFPTMTHGGPPSRIFQWQGILNKPGFNHVLAIGDIEACESADLPRSSVDVWKQVPEVYNGRGRLNLRGKGIEDGAFFGFDLYCRPAAFDEIARVFTLGVGPPHDVLSLKIVTAHPDRPDGGDNYWHTQWRNDTWEVIAWEIFAGATVEGFVPQ
jgi:hypothetical protein